ncbi:MAG: DUF2066 domain-containing protein [Pseudomonadota bacterium]
MIWPTLTAHAQSIRCAHGAGSARSAAAMAASLLTSTTRADHLGAKLLAAGAIFALTHAALAQNAVPIGVYSARVEVADRTGSTLRQAQKAGLEQVLIKATGDPDAPQVPSLQEDLREPSRLLLGYSYEESTIGNLRLRLNYDEKAVQGLISAARLPLWTSNRPTVLVWLVSTDDRRSFVTLDEAPKATRMLVDNFEMRGVPLQQPLHDLEDAAALSPGEAWRLDSAALVGASRRYGDRLLLAGRMAELSDGRVSGEWRFLDEGRWITSTVRAGPTEEFMKAGADLVARRLAERYAVVAQSGSLDTGYRLVVRGARSYLDFAAIRETLVSLEAVTYAVPEFLQGDLIEFRLEADAERGRLKQLIELDRRFVPVPGNDSTLRYEWLR